MIDFIRKIKDFIFTLFNKHNNTTMINIVLFGKPGAGKGTQANFLKEKYDLIHISTGDLFRYHLKNDTDLGKLAASYSSKGILVPDEVTNKMLMFEVNKYEEPKGFIFDGYPRTKTQAEVLDSFLQTKNAKVSATIALEADEDVLTERLLERGKTSGRADDTDESKIRIRFKEYNEKTAPLIDFYSCQDKFYAVNGIGEIAEITERLTTVIDNL